jgi:Na+/melibiose symporter-like transporter
VDLAVGHAMSTRVRSLGDLCRVQLRGAVGSGLTLVAFSATGLVPEDTRFLYAVATSCLFRLAYTFYDLPQNAVLSLVRTGIDGRLQISAVRLVFSGLAAVLVAMAAALLASSTATSGAERFVAFSIVLMLAGSVSSLALRRISPPPARPDWPVQLSQTRQRLAVTLQPVWLMLILFFFVGGATSVFSRLEPYFSSAALPSYGARTTVLTFIALGGALGQPLWMAVSRRIPPHHLLRWSALVQASGAAMFLLCAGRSTLVAALAGAAYGCGLGGVNMLLWGMLAAEAVKLATAIAVIGVSELLATVDYHSTRVAGSLTFLGPMAGAPLLAAVICYLAAPVLAGHGGRR